MSKARVKHEAHKRAVTQLQRTKFLNVTTKPAPHILSLEPRHKKKNPDVKPVETTVEPHIQKMSEKFLGQYPSHFSKRHESLPTASEPETLEVNAQP